MKKRHVSLPGCRTALFCILSLALGPMAACEATPGTETEGAAQRTETADVACPCDETSDVVDAQIVASDVVESIDDAGTMDAEGPAPETAEFLEEQTDYELASDFFGIEVVHAVDILLPEPSMLSLENEPYEWVSADIVVDGELVKEIGVRLKGKYGSFREIHEKAAFNVKFNYFVSGQFFKGLRKMALNNMVQDASMIHEYLAYTLFRAADVPASRSGYAWVTVNGEPYGLYATVEATDNKPFLEHWFGDKDGALFEGEYGVDVYTDLVPDFDQDAGDGGVLSLYVLTEALNDLEDGPDIAEGLAGLIDLERYLDFAATEIYLGHWDGYAWTRNNYFIYDNPQEGLWVWLPWGLDQTFWDHLEPFGGEGRIQQLCISDMTCMEMLHAAFLDVIERVDALDLRVEAVLTQELVVPLASLDPKKESSLEDTIWAGSQVNTFLWWRPDTLAEGFLCLEPEQVDEDGDGWSGCFDDCDDRAYEVHPGAEELCNFRDDDCDGEIDEGEDCPSCHAVTSPEGSTFLICGNYLNWQEARQECLSAGGDLASIHSQEEQSWLVKTIEETMGGDAMWIGLHDHEQEGEFVWTDGSSLDFQSWYDYEPNNWGEDEHCTHLDAYGYGGWNDLFCFHELRYICKLSAVFLP